MINVALLKEICKIPGAPGFENRIRQYLLNEAAPYVDSISTDAMGNVIAFRKGRVEKKVMVAAHMDEIGFIVTHITEEGFLRFHTLGGFDAKTLTAQRVIVHGKKDVIGVMGSKPIHALKPDERNKAPMIEHYYIDLGMSKEEAEKWIEVGDPITRERELIEMGDCINGKSVDNRVSVFVLLESLKKLKDKDLPYDLYAVFTVQEEIGIRGAIAATQIINPDFGFGLDVTVAYDVPGASGHEKVTSLGKGAAIKILDSSVISDYRMVRFLKHIGKENNINWQAEILPRGGTDTSGLQRYGKNGAIVGAISIPTRHLHQVIEMANKSDIHAAIELLTESLLKLDTWDWSF